MDNSNDGQQQPPVPPAQPPVQQPPPQIIYQQVPPQREGCFLQTMNAGCQTCGFVVVAIIVLCVVALFAGQCGTSKYRGSSLSNPHYPETATIATNYVGELVAGHPGNLLVLHDLDGSAFDNYLSAAETDYKKLAALIDEGKCRLIRDEETVKVVSRSRSAAGWWLIQYDGRSWWASGAFLVDDDGKKLNEYKVY